MLLRIFRALPRRPVTSQCPGGSAEEVEVHVLLFLFLDLFLLRLLLRRRCPGRGSTASATATAATCTGGACGLDVVSEILALTHLLEQLRKHRVDDAPADLISVLRF